MGRNSGQREVQNILGGACFWQVDIVRYWISGMYSGGGRRPVLVAAWEFQCWAHRISHGAQLLIVEKYLKLV